MLTPAAQRIGLAQRPRGMAALTVVMVLFFIMALVAAYTNRNLIFEQRISVGAYRAARAADAGDAALNWGLALLNGGRINSQCLPSTNLNDQDFRLMATNQPAADSLIEGGYALPTGSLNSTEAVSGCIIAEGALACACPTTTTPNPTITAPANGLGSAFHVTVFLPGDANPKPGTLGLLGFGCGSLGAGDNDCSRAVGANAKPQVDGVGGASVVLGLVRALPLAPQATLTVGGTVNASAGSLLVSNPDSSSGYTVLSGLAYTAGTNDRFAVPAGTAGEGRQHDINDLTELVGRADDGWFRAFFGMDRTNFRLQPAARLVDCSAGCTQADVTAVLAGYPRNPVVLDGDLTLTNAAVLGSATNPAMLVVNGRLTIAGNATIIGFVHANSVAWSAATATLSGALVTPGDFTVTGTARLGFDRAAINIVRLRYGSFVRTTGSWNIRDRYR